MGEGIRWRGGRDGRRDGKCVREGGRDGCRNRWIEGEKEKEDGELQLDRWRERR